MTERPILFSGEMVRAILAGTKTQTRRVLSPQPELAIMDAEAAGALRAAADAGLVPGDEKPRWRWRGCFSMPWPSSLRHSSPYGVPGDRLWVRETCIIADKNFPDYRDPSWPRDNEGVPRVVQYLATHPDRTHAADYGYTKATPSIHMPRWASRILLEVTSVRVERLQDISEEDARAEGVTPNEHDAWFGGLKYVSAFGTLWDQINGKRAPWASNQWVWVVSFARAGG